MLPTRKAVALILGVSAILSFVTIAQAQKPSESESPDVLKREATVDWFQKSDVSALREGVIDKMELRLGKRVEKGKEIGRLHKEVADLAVEEARIQARGTGAVLKSLAQKGLALTVVARNEVLTRRASNIVSREDVDKAQAELAAADASVIEAKDTQELAQAKLKSAERAAEEHIIRAPFTGQILKEYKHEGESVAAREPVVVLANLDTMRIWAHIPIEYVYRVTPGTKIVIQPRLGEKSTGTHPIEQKVFRGEICFVDQAIQPIGEKAVKIYADIDNPNHELKHGMKATMTIFLNPEGTSSYASPGGLKEASAPPPSVGARQENLPTLPR